MRIPAVGGHARKERKGCGVAACTAYHSKPYPTLAISATVAVMSPDRSIRVEQAHAATPGTLAIEGQVLGIDVGYSGRNATTGFCVLRWDAERVDLQCEAARSDESSRITKLRKLGLDRGAIVDAVAIDGPLRPELKYERSYRAAESALSRGILQKRGKPGQTSAGSGPRLHQAATDLALLSLKELSVGETESPLGISQKALVEAFPNLFLGFLCEDDRYPLRPTRRRRWTDSLFPFVKDSVLGLIDDLLPGRKLAIESLPSDHEGIAAFVCALTGLCFRGGAFVAVGSAHDGYIILPPFDAWGINRQGDRWPEVVLRAAMPRVRESFPEIECISSRGGRSVRLFAPPA